MTFLKISEANMRIKAPKNPKQILKNKSRNKKRLNKPNKLKKTPRNRKQAINKPKIRKIYDATNNLNIK